MLRLLAEARARRLPAAPLVSRLEEGLTKGAPPAAILRALQARLRALEQAAAALDESGYKDASSAPYGELLSAVALALESGLAPGDLGPILKRGGGQFAFRMTSVIEASESMRLAGIGTDTVRDLMNDCLDRSLGRMEILRASRYAIEQHRQGVADADLRRALWDGNPPSPAGGHGRGGGPPGNGRR